MPDSQVVIPLPLGMVKAFLLPGADGRAILVDTGMANTARRLQRQIADRGFAPTAISLILLTHAHLDHIGGLPALVAWTQAPVAIGRLDLEMARTGQEPPVQHMTGSMRLLRRLVGQLGIPHLEPDVLIDGEMDLATYGVAGRTLHTPGHSPGSISVWLEGGEILIGDLIRGSLLSPTRPALPPIINDMVQLKQSIERVLELEPRLIHASHGGPFTPEALRHAFPR